MLTLAGAVLPVAEAPLRPTCKKPHDMFLNPRNSIVDIVQSVGRVMRRAEGKKFGYIILPTQVWSLFEILILHQAVKLVADDVFKMLVEIGVLYQQGTEFRIGDNLDELNFSFITENDETHLIYVEVELDWKSNEEEAYADLQQKLTTVYGEGFHKTDEYGITDYYIWKGANNTAVQLNYSQRSLSLTYGVLDVDERLAQIEAQIEPVDHDDTSGL